ncbi:Carbon-nitrogen hydrolase [Carpediemonas membranifera]|uniref:Carbon-nitrogen hydrolase n=1 Tax=Carpediemonas membranifera TaxID=201153 RepID=A0A8J6BTP8_9EUKA|nr:Carbon-nitrogen hydrolase [Carpediemonas membranifera]|eukprot:KAG9389571.1 Carbon-nitrogen hydrolase [Carpediemonas membranifera]
MNQHRNVLDVVDSLPDEQRKVLYRELYGPEVESIELDTELISRLEEKEIELKAYKMQCKLEELRDPRVVRIAAIQNKFASSPSAPFAEQWQIMSQRMAELIDTAAAAGAHIVCLQECWTTAFVMATREKIWNAMAVPAAYGPAADFISAKAKEHRMVILSPILERDEAHADTIHNATAIFNAAGQFVGKTRKNHIPRVGDFNEANYYTEATDGHPVFEVLCSNGVVARIGVNICFGRHHPLNWLSYSLNGAEVIFNPSATTDGLSEPLWSIEARNAAIANSVYTVAINRVGTETFPREFTSGDMKPAHKDFGHFYGSSYVTAPNGQRTPGLSRAEDGVLVTEVDLNLQRQTRDAWMFNVTMRGELYRDMLQKYCEAEFVPQRVVDPALKR